MVITFITILAYVGAVVGTLVGALISYIDWDYNKKTDKGTDGIEKLLDTMQGYTKVYKPGKWWLIALISWAWLITTWVS